MTTKLIALGVGFGVMMLGSLFVKLPRLRKVLYLLALIILTTACWLVAFTLWGFPGRGRSIVLLILLAIACWLFVSALAWGFLVMRPGVPVHAQAEEPSASAEAESPLYRVGIFQNRPFSYLPEDGGAEIGYVAIRSKDRGKKLGYRLLMHILKEMKRRGIPYAYLRTDSFRLPAIKTYLKCGFSPWAEAENEKARWKSVLEAIENNI